MEPFRRVDDRQAGPTALGILLPPGQRTVVIVRPRALSFDLLAGVPGPDAMTVRFHEFGRDEAAGIALRLLQHLGEQARQKSDLLEVAALPGANGYLVWLRDGDFCWVVCARRAGQAYEAMRFATLDAAQDAASQLAKCLCPAPDAAQQVYFNTQHFARQGPIG
jgi:hypothetical protein